MSALPIKKLTREEYLWENGQALKVLAFADLRYTNPEEFWELAKYQPFPKKDSRKNK